ncbi:MAG: carboxypeptidase regulatory-like domain-containing protein, partial [Candidatus Sericytochromatia bacterium]|nr:carboxypeptidase regulatory-like domain-containing protein [Candidatus Sericytochromatia bacterium]
MAIKPRPVLAFCSLIALTVACQPTGTTVTPGQTPKPSAAPSMIPSATPQPTNTPSAPIATPTAALPTPTPSPSAQAAASIKGTVQDDLGTAVFALSVRLEDMTTGLTIADTTTDPLGAYRFDRVPQGGNVRVSVSGKGYGLRQAILGIPPGPDGAYTYAQDFTKNLA